MKLRRTESLHQNPHFIEFEFAARLSGSGMQLTSKRKQPVNRSRIRHTKILSGDYVLRRYALRAILILPFVDLPFGRAPEVLCRCGKPHKIERAGEIALQFLAPDYRIEKAVLQ